MDALTAPLELGFFVRALIASALVGLLSDRLHLPLGTAIGVCAAVAYAMVVVVALCLPETRGRDLHQN